MDAPPIAGVFEGLKPVGWCQTNVNRSPNCQMMRISHRRLAPFGQHGQRGSAIFFKSFAAVEVTFEIEMIADRSMGGRELLQGLYDPEFRHRTIPSPERLV